MVHVVQHTYFTSIHLCNINGNENNNYNNNKAIVDYTLPALCTPVTPLPPIGDAAYRQHAGGGPNHGCMQHDAQKNLVKIAGVVPEIFSWTDRHTHHNTSQPLPWMKYRNSTQKMLTVQCCNLSRAIAIAHPVHLTNANGS